MVHMLERAREVHKINKGETGRDSVIKCPFCIADADEQWFVMKFDYAVPHPRPENLGAPHCAHCPLQSLFNVDTQELMDDCVKMGYYALRSWEDTDEEDRDYSG
jgi:hypothetical protein